MPTIYLVILMMMPGQKEPIELADVEVATIEDCWAQSKPALERALEIHPGDAFALKASCIVEREQTTPAKDVE